MPKDDGSVQSQKKHQFTGKIKNTGTGQDEKRTHNPRIFVVVVVGGGGAVGSGGGEGGGRFGVGGRGGSHGVNPSAINIKVLEDFFAGNGDVAAAGGRRRLLGGGGEDGGVGNGDGDGHVDAGFGVGNYHILIRHIFFNDSVL